MYYSYCSCINRTRFIKTTSLEYEDDVLILTIPPMKLKNHDKIYLLIEQELPKDQITPDTLVVVYVGDSSEKFMTATRLGNYLYADALQNKKYYPLYAATDSNVFIIQDINKLCRTEHIFPILPAVIPPK